MSGDHDWLTLRHKYTLFLSTDGNFRLQRKRKHDDPDDEALNNGRAYFVEDKRYMVYLDQVDQPDDVSIQISYPFTASVSLDD